MFDAASVNKFKITSSSGDLEYAHIKDMKNETVFTKKEIKEHLINENANERKRQAKCHEDTLNVVRQHFNNASWLNDVLERTDNPNRMSTLDYMVYHFEEDYFHPPRPSKPIIQLEPMIAKIAFGFNYENNHPDNTKLERLRKMLNMIEVLAKQGKIEINKLPKDSTYEQLDAVYGNMIDNAYEYETQMINALQTRGFNQEYELVEGVDFKTANYYGNHSCPGGELCYTQGESTWNNYTNDGVNKAYILLRKGWEDISAQHDDNFISPELSYSGYDTYGLSMIFVFVDPDKRLAYCNTRWNHNAKYRNDCNIDHAMTRLDLSKLVGAKFWDIFKPYSPDELLEMGYIPFDRVQEMLDRGVNPDRIFQIWERPAVEGFFRVKLNGKWNFLTEDYKILHPEEWFYSIGTFDKGFVRVSNQEHKWNFLTSNGELLWKGEWFYNVGGFSEGFAMVSNQEDKFNFLTPNGDLLWKGEWFNYVVYFKNGFAAVQNQEDKWNFLTPNGDLLWKGEWFNYAFKFKEGFARVLNQEGKWNFLTPNGEILWNGEWFDGAYDFENGFARVQNQEGKWNFLTPNGEILWEGEWFKGAGDFENGFARVQNQEYKWFLLDEYGDLYDTDENLIHSSNSTLRQVNESLVFNKKTLNEYIDEFDGNVDLTSFCPQKELNPRIWPHNRINSKVRLRLLEIADEFVDALNVDWAKPKDIILTGSLANYNWSKFSDFDLHILMDFSEVDERTEFVKEYFDSKKKIWNDAHEDIKIYDFPVELYVQDINELHTATGVYSLERDKWLVKPEANNIKAIMLNKFFIKEKVAKFCNKIEELEESIETEKDLHKVEVLGEKVKSLLDKIKGLRKSGLEKAGEMSSGNIIFKVLRRNGYLERLIDLKNKAYDKLKSLN